MVVIDNQFFYDASTTNTQRQYLFIYLVALFC
jgi:hypothetical protein